MFFPNKPIPLELLTLVAITQAYLHAEVCEQCKETLPPEFDTIVNLLYSGTNKERLEGFVDKFYGSVIGLMRNAKYELQKEGIDFSPVSLAILSLPCTH